MSAAWHAYDRLFEDDRVALLVEPDAPSRVLHSGAASASEFENHIQRHDEFGTLRAEDCRFSHA